MIPPRLDVATARDIHRAMLFAVEVHADQLDKSGVPYILHPLRVAEAVPPPYKAAALLHDCAEDEPEDEEVVPDRMLSEGIQPTTVRAVGLLTRYPGQTYDEYIDRIVQAVREGPDEGRIARRVKVADIQDNLARLTPELEGLKYRYRRARLALGIA